jgi:hypothetical protein
MSDTQTRLDAHERLLRFMRGVFWYDEIREDVGVILNERDALAAELERVTAQLAAVDEHLGPWEPEPGSDVGCVGRVQTILNLKADRAELERVTCECDAPRCQTHGCQDRPTPGGTQARLDAIREALDLGLQAWRSTKSGPKFLVASDALNALATTNEELREELARQIEDPLSGRGSHEHWPGQRRCEWCDLGTPTRESS